MVLTYATSAQAALLVTESFTYSSGSLNGNSGGTGFSSAWGDNPAGVQTASIGVNAVQVNPSGQAANNPAGASVQFSYRGLSDPFGSSGVIWMALDEQAVMNDPGAFNFATISLFVGTFERFDVGKWLVPGTTADDTNWAMSRAGSTGVNDVVVTSKSITTLKTAVVRFNLALASNEGSVNLWVGSGVGPVDVSGAPDATLTGLNLTGVDTIRLGGGDGGSPPISFAIDNLK
ncbi:MAG: hypothetical protein H7062_08675, partial [Candidatus Saccharimonas sp.]|nr:hypothetical protein [Planctomycetaceae bacterium]